MTTVTHYCLGKPIFWGSAAVAAATEIITKMGVKFLGTPIEQFDQLCNEEEIVMIEISCFKMEEFGHRDVDDKNGPSPFSVDEIKKQLCL
ncbi:MAG TPA: hypothetical protein VE089_02185 [Nitrososphaeraceae archaeon]|jgi:hypothetical protein|nr:hypothetical protein [Nitrososphaeraceae archaeon]